MASRFRFRIDQGVQRGTSELHVLQMNQVGDVDELAGHFGRAWRRRTRCCARWPSSSPTVPTRPRCP